MRGISQNERAMAVKTQCPASHKTTQSAKRHESREEKGGTQSRRNTGIRKDAVPASDKTTQSAQRKGPYRLAVKISSEQLTHFTILEHAIDSGL
jgi:hypothetical protein